jgi:hypothetical protein
MTLFADSLTELACQVLACKGVNGANLALAQNAVDYLPGGYRNSSAPGVCPLKYSQFSTVLSAVDNPLNFAHTFCAKPQG